METKLEKLISEGSSTVYFSLNPAVPSNEIWTKENSLEKAISTNSPGDAVTLIGIQRDEKGHETYFVHGVYEIMPFTNKIKDDNYSKVYNSMIPGVAYINPASLGINPDEFLSSPDKETGPVKNGSKEFLGIINLDYIVNTNEEKISGFFRNGAYLLRKPGKETNKYVEPAIDYKVIKNVGQGAGLVSSKITDKIADKYGFQRPKPGDVIVGIGYFEDRKLQYKKQEPIAFPLVVSAEGDKLQVPVEAIDSMYFELFLGFNKKTGKRIIA